MSKNGKIECGNEDQKDIQWFKNYEKRSRTKHLENLKNKDILDYIKDIEQNCRLEVSSGDEDYAGTKRSSNCSVRYSGTRFKSLKKIKSRVKSKKNKNVAALERKIKRSSSHNTMDACNYCCPSQKSHFCSNPDLTVHENSRKYLNTAAKKSTYRYLKPSSKGNSYKYRESSPRFYGSYSRMGHKMWPAVTEMTSLEVIKDSRSQDVIPKSKINGSRIIDRKSAKIRTFKSLRRKKSDKSIYSNIVPSHKKTKERNYVNEQKVDTRTKQLNEESDVSDFVNQQSLNQFYSGRSTACKTAALSYQAPLQNGSYRERYISGYHYPVKRSRQPTSWGLSSRSNRLKGVPEMGSLPQRRTLRRENEVGSPLKASSSITGVLIDRNYRRARESKYKNNTDRRRREPGVLGERGSSCYRRPSFLRESEKLCEMVRTSENKQWLGCCCEDAEQDETVDCSRYCRCPENVNDSAWRNYRPQYESTRRLSSNGTSKRINYEREKTLREMLSKSVQSRNTNRREFDFNLSTKGDLRHETVYDDFAFDRSETISDDVSRNDCGDKIESEELKPHVSFPDDSAYQAPYGESNKLTREYKLSNDLKNSREEAIETKMLRKKATRRYPSGKELSFETRRTPRKVASGNYSRLRHDAAESTCECKEPFHDPPAACLTGSCTCIGNNENAERSDNDSPRRISTVYCCCSSSSLYDETDPVKKLESFCEKVKAVNQNVLRKTSRSAFSNAARTNAQRYSYGGSDEQNRSEISTTRVSRSIEREWLTDPTRLRLGKPNHSRGKTSLERILIYPPRGEVGPPLTLYKQASNINCQVKGDVNTGFRYSVTYVQKFVSPSWMPSLSPQVLSSETDEECGCSADYG